MNPEQTELFHQALLQVLDGNATRFGLGHRALATLVKVYGFNPTAAEVERAMDYLGDPANNLAALVNRNQMHPENWMWRLTAAGTNYLRERGL